MCDSTNTELRLSKLCAPDILATIRNASTSSKIFMFKTYLLPQSLKLSPGLSKYFNARGTVESSRHSLARILPFLQSA